MRIMARSRFAGHTEPRPRPSRRALATARTKAQSTRTSPAGVRGPAGRVNKLFSSPQTSAGQCLRQYLSKSQGPG